MQWVNTPNYNDNTMATIDDTLLEIEQHTQNANSVKEIVLSRLEEDGVITPEQASLYADKWQVIIIKKNWFQRWMKKFGKPNGGSYQFKYVKFED